MVFEHAWQQPAPVMQEWGQHNVRGVPRYTTGKMALLASAIAVMHARCIEISFRTTRDRPCAAILIGGGMLAVGMLLVPVPPRAPYTDVNSVLSCFPHVF